jgi:purine-binding chemotaxis protein CheW
MSADTQDAEQFATFLVAGHYFGIEVLHVQEVLREQRVTPVPFAPASVEGLINLRGQIVPAVNMRTLLHLPQQEGAAISPSIVVRTQHGPVSLQVDEIQDVLELDKSGHELPPGNLKHNLLELVTGIHRLDDRLLMLLDARKAASACAATPVEIE